MKKYDFEKFYDRKNTNSWKYDFCSEYGKSEDVLPMWIADMDYPSPKEVVEKMQEIATRGIYGYGRPRESYFEALNGWFSSRFDFEINPDWVVFTPGIVFALNAAVQTFTQKGDGVLVQRPVYYPFLNAINNNGRKLISNSLKYENGRYSMDFDDLENKIKTHGIKLMLLCSPHNPVGRVWTVAELSRVAEICTKYGVTVVADEIHCDFVYGANKHTSFATLSDEVKKHCIVCTAPSKTFNLAGLQTSNIIIPDEKIRTRFKEAVLASGYEYPNLFGISACETAYRFGGEWLSELLEHFYGTYLFMADYCKKNIPDIFPVELQGTYLPWFDCNAKGLTHSQLIQRIEEVGKLWLDEGTMFGPEGSGFIRFNIACPRALVAEAMDRLCRAINS